ncbi:MAG: insulinase family protein [Desulfobacteraceae bacterium]|nr:insulinase family protein [Desulfobacteraceae bacterium]MBU4000741.1 insulinase family protein [Pseudomonadota bacterium]
MAASPEKTTLQNGIRILSKKIPGARSVSMGIWVNVGARDEQVTDNGLCHFIEHMLFKGTRKRSGFEIAKQFDAIGGQTNAFTSMETTCYHAKVIASHTAIMSDVLSDIFLNSLFDPSEIEKERPVIFQEICMVEDNPDEYIHTLASQSFWGNNSLGRSILGSRENVTRFDRKTIQTFFADYYQPDRIVIAAAGHIDHQQLLDRMGSEFDAIPRGAGFPNRVTPSTCAQVDINYKKLEQVHVCINTRGISISDDNRYALSLINTILGGNMSSRLFQKIREERGLAYSVYSYASSFEDTGMFGAYAGTDPHQVATVIDLILQEMRDIKNQKVLASELQNAKEYTKGSLLLASESIDNQMVRLAQNEINMGKQISMEKVIRKIDAVTEDHVMELARNLFDSNHLSLTTLGPVKKKDLPKDMVYL